MILIVDDDKAIRMSLGLMLRRAGHDVDYASGKEEAVAKFRAAAPDLIILDMNYGLTTTGEDGLELLRKARILLPDVPVILITAWGSIDLAVEGMRAGAYDFITKPWNNHALLQRIETALSLNSPKEPETKAFDRCGIIGRNPRLTELLETVERIAPTDAPVLILGENGTGKELVANAIHANSRRSKATMVMVNLGGISQSLFESEMFGYVKGAFTGAAGERKGRFELADKGTIFLDEIGDLDMASQVKMLRVLQSHTFEPLGDSRPRKVDIRVVCATNADLPSMVKERRFREDLFYRINLITLRLPALRERRDDIPLLARHFVREAARGYGMDVPEISPEAMEMLTRLPYPGNIRQLKNMVERAVLVGGPVIGVDAFDTEESASGGEAPAAASSLDEVERKALEEALRRAAGNMTQAARALGVTRQTLYRRMEKHGLR